MDRELFTVTELAHVLGVTKRTVRIQLDGLGIQPKNIEIRQNSQVLRYHKDAILSLRTAINWKRVESRKRKP